MAVTIHDVARLARVSQATAGRALGGYGYVGAQARARVEAAARTLGYVPNSVARALASGVSGVIGLVVGDIENPFFAAAARGLADVVEARGYTVLLANSDEDEEREQAAVAALRAPPGRRPRRDAALELGLAASRGGARSDARRPARPHRARARGRRRDRRQRGRRARGDRAPARARPPPHRHRHRRARDRELGRAPARLSRGARGRRRRGRRRAVSVGGSSRAEGYRAAQALLALDPRPTALFSSNNFMTVGHDARAARRGPARPARHLARRLRRSRVDDADRSAADRRRPARRASSAARPAGACWRGSTARAGGRGGCGSTPS